jgi:muramoyltetrapeptide carboxypeptidase LdcA involved in peptidoglycan recycling
VVTRVVNEERQKIKNLDQANAFLKAMGLNIMVGRTITNVFYVEFDKDEEFLEMLKKWQKYEL